MRRIYLKIAIPKDTVILLIADQKLTEDLTVNYEVVLDTGNFATKEATIRKAHLTFTETHTESRINVTGVAF